MAALLASLTPEDTLLEWLDAFLRIPNWAEARRLVETQPELLSADADALLGELAAAQSNPVLREYIEQRRTLLARCRKTGLAPAFDLAAQTRLGEVPIPTEHEAAVLAVAALLAE